MTEPPKFNIGTLMRREVAARYPSRFHPPVEPLTPEDAEKLQHRDLSGVADVTPDQTREDDEQQ